MTLPKEQSRQTLGAESNLSSQGPFLEKHLGATPAYSDEKFGKWRQESD